MIFKKKIERCNLSDEHEFSKNQTYSSSNSPFLRSNTMNDALLTGDYDDHSGRLFTIDGDYCTKDPDENGLEDYGQVDESGRNRSYGIYRKC